VPVFLLFQKASATVDEYRFLHPKAGVTADMIGLTFAMTVWNIMYNHAEDE